MNYVEMKMDKAYKRLIKSIGSIKKSKSGQENAANLKDAAWFLLETDLENMHKAIDETHEYLDYLKRQVRPVTSENEKFEAVSALIEMKMTPPEELLQTAGELQQYRRRNKEVCSNTPEQLVASDLKVTSNIPPSAPPASVNPGAQTKKQQRASAQQKGKKHVQCFDLNVTPLWIDDSHCQFEKQVQLHHP